MKINHNYFLIIISFSLITIKTDVFSTLAVAFPNAGFNHILMTKRSVSTSGSITTSIESENDDVEIWTSQIWFDGENNQSDMYMGADGNTPVWGAFRFRIPTAIPAGATITSANFSVYGTDTYYWVNNEDYLHVLVNDSNDAPQVTAVGDEPGGASGYYFTSSPGATSGGPNVIVRWPTAGTLTWNSGGSLNIGPDVSSLIQFLVNKYGGLTANSHIQFWIYSQVYRPSGPEVKLADYGHPTLSAPMLIVNWTK